MLWKLRLFWYRADKAGLAFAIYAVLLLGGLAFGYQAVAAYRDGQNARIREFHAKSVDCLARNVYYEARGESLAGQYAVAEVTMNRKGALGYPKTVCEVVYEKYAFSWTLTRNLQTPAGDAWRRAEQVAHDVYYQRRPRELHGALYYHATYVQPDWAGEKERIGRIGRHVFYR